MAISGTWSARYANAQAYTGARRWGTGYNPIHEVRDNPGRVTGIKENLFTLGDPSDAPPDNIINADDFVGADWEGEQPYPDEVYRYQEARPRWDERTEQFRGESSSAAMGEQGPWGPLYPEDADFPLGGPTGGNQDWLNTSHGENVERQHAIAIPTPGVSGGWVNKARGRDAMAEAQDPADPGYQLAINTSPLQGQGVKSRVNDRAVARGTDAAREPIQARTAGMVARVFGMSLGMGGGAGTPDMQPYQQTAGLKRPFVMRSPTLPPMEDHYWNEMEGRVPLQRTVPPDPYQGDPESAAATGGVDEFQDSGSDWGY